MSTFLPSTLVIALKYLPVGDIFTSAYSSPRLNNCDCDNAFLADVSAANVLIGMMGKQITANAANGKDFI